MANNKHVRVRNGARRLRFQKRCNEHLDEGESNLNKFWRQCRERDLRKYSKSSPVPIATQSGHFESTVKQLKLDAQKLSRLYQKRVTAKPCNLEPNADSEDAVTGPLSTTSPLCSGDKQSRENTKMFFEYRNYFSSLHNKGKAKSPSRIKSRFKSLYKASKRVKKFAQMPNFFASPIKPTASTRCQSTMNAESIKDHSNTNECKDDSAVFDKLKESDSVCATDGATENSSAILVDDVAQFASTYHLSNADECSEYSEYSVRQLKGRLRELNVATDKCIEKSDLINKLKSYHNQESTNLQSAPQQMPIQIEHPAVEKGNREPVMIKKSREEKNKTSFLYEGLLNDRRESKHHVIARVDAWIHRWSYRRSFRQLLNTTLGNKYKDKDYLHNAHHPMQSDFKSVMKLYKKAILIIHPDRHVQSCFEVQYKSAEMFKVLTAKCDGFRKRRKS